MCRCTRALRPHQLPASGHSTGAPAFVCVILVFLQIIISLACALLAIIFIESYTHCNRCFVCHIRIENKFYLQVFIESSYDKHIATY